MPFVCPGDLKRYHHGQTVPRLGLGYKSRSPMAVRRSYSLHKAYHRFICWKPVLPKSAVVVQIRRCKIDLPGRYNRRPCHVTQVTTSDGGWCLSNPCALIIPPLPPPGFHSPVSTAVRIALSRILPVVNFGLAPHLFTGTSSRQVGPLLRLNTAVCDHQLAGFSVVDPGPSATEGECAAAGVATSIVFWILPAKSIFCCSTPLRAVVSPFHVFYGPTLSHASFHIQAAATNKT